MKIIIIILIWISFVDFTSAAVRGPRLNLPRRPVLFQGGSRVYVHMPDDRVFSGHFCSDAIPGWAIHPNKMYSSIYGAYLRLPSRKGMVSKLTPLPHALNINDDIPEKHRCFVSTRKGAVLSAALRRYNGEDLMVTSHPRIFLRMPDDKTVYVGELDYDHGRRPSWLEQKRNMY